MKIEIVKFIRLENFNAIYIDSKPPRLEAKVVFDRDNISQKLITQAGWQIITSFIVFYAFTANSMPFAINTRTRAFCFIFSLYFYTPLA